METYIHTLIAVDANFAPEPVQVTEFISWIATQAGWTQHRLWHLSLDFGSFGRPHRCELTKIRGPEKPRRCPDRIRSTFAVLSRFLR